MPTRFLDWSTEHNVAGFDAAIAIIRANHHFDNANSYRVDTDFLRLVKHVREWIPARRRNSEAEYKIELRKHLELLGHKLNEEFGESKYDLLVRGKYAVELKRDPDLSEYDRLFGQLSRHLQHQCKVIVHILDATRKDKLDNFSSLVDKYLNVELNSIEVIGR